MKIFFLSKNRCSALLGLFFLLLATSIVSAATRTSTAAGGTWATGSTWVGGVAPVAGDDVIIATTVGNSVSLGANATIVNVTINPGATLSVLSRRLTVNGFFTNNGTVTGANNSQVNLATGNFINSGSVTFTGTGQVNVTAGTFNNTGSILIATGQINVVAGSFSSTNSLIFTGAGFLKLGGAFSYSGTFTLGTAQVQFIGTANQSIPAFTTSGTVSMLKTGGTATLTGNVTGGGLTLNGLGGTLDLVSGTHTFNGNWTRTNGNLNCGSSLLRIGLSATGTGGTGTFDAGTGTVEYYRTNTQTAASLVYNNLVLSGSNTKTFATTPTVNGKLTLAGTAVVAVTTGVVTYGPNATLQYDTTTARTVSSEEWISPFTASGGIVVNCINNITLNAAKVFGLSSPLTITNIGKLVTNNFGLTFGGDFVVNAGGTFTAGSAPIVITNTMGSQSIAGFTTTGLVSMTKTSGTATFGGNVSGAGITINGGGTLNLGSGLSHTLTGAVNLTAGI